MKKEKVNVNTAQYWNNRFKSGDWEKKGGFSQTKYFAEAQIPHLNLSSDFNGILCDFGCGAGDAFVVYKNKFPQAKLLGIDFSMDAINLCIEKYGDIASFECLNAKNIPKVDLIICSNVIEHVDNQFEIISDLLKKCEKLFVIVPYKENPLSYEHMRQYDENSFEMFKPLRYVIYLSKGWSKFGFDLFFNVYFKNVFRYILGKNCQRQRKQILFEFLGEK